MAGALLLARGAAPPWLRITGNSVSVYNHTGLDTYKRQKDNWFVVSGYIGPKIFYQKTFLSNDMFKTFYIEYPESQRSIYDPILSRLGSSFKG